MQKWRKKKEGDFRQIAQNGLTSLTCQCHVAHINVTDPAGDGSYQSGGLLLPWGILPEGTPPAREGRGSKHKYSMTVDAESTQVDRQGSPKDSLDVL